MMACLVMAVTKHLLLVLIREMIANLVVSGTKHWCRYSWSLLLD